MKGSIFLTIFLHEFSLPVLIIQSFLLQDISSPIKNPSDHERTFSSPFHFSSCHLFTKYSLNTKHAQALCRETNQVHSHPQRSSQLLTSLYFLLALNVGQRLQFQNYFKFCIFFPWYNEMNELSNSPSAKEQCLGCVTNSSTSVRTHRMGVWL